MDVGDAADEALLKGDTDDEAEKDADEVPDRDGRGVPDSLPEFDGLSLVEGERLPRAVRDCDRVAV